MVFCAKETELLDSIKDNYGLDDELDLLVREANEKYTIDDSRERNKKMHAITRAFMNLEDNLEKQMK